MLYPLKMTPYFRHGADTPWGGSALGELFGKAIPDALTGERVALPVSVEGMSIRYLRANKAR